MQSQVGDNVVRGTISLVCNAQHKNVLDSKRINEVLLSDCAFL